jgi:hypothetical protein
VRSSSSNSGVPISVSMRATVSPSDAAVRAPRLVATRSKRHRHRGRVVDEVEQIIERATGIGCRPSVKLGLHLRGTVTLWVWVTWGDRWVSTPMASYKGHRYPVGIINHCVWL